MLDQKYTFFIIDSWQKRRKTEKFADSCIPIVHCLCTKGVFLYFKKYIYIPLLPKKKKKKPEKFSPFTTQELFKVYSFKNLYDKIPDKLLPLVHP